MRIEQGFKLPTVTPDGIYGFFGDYRFLSNFHLCPLELDGLSYPSSEHAYMAQKSLDPDWRKRLALQGLTPIQARRLGQTVALRPHWGELRLCTMHQVLSHKFLNPDMRRRLLATQDKYLEETNDWGDRFWGVCEGQGLNWLGRLLMQVREHYRACETPQAAPAQPDLFG